MQRDTARLIEKVVREIKPSDGELAHCHGEVESAIQKLAIDKLNHEVLTVPGTKEANRRLRPLRDAIQRVKHHAKGLHDALPFLSFEIFQPWKSHNDYGTPEDIRSHGYNQFIADLNDLIIHIERYENFKKIDFSTMK
jgi:hypothetical protein